MHLKRSNTQKFWPVARKGTAYLARPLHNQNESIPLIVAMRDVLKLVKNKKELKRILHEKEIKINQRIVRETNYPISLFDILSLVRTKKNYRAELTAKKKLTLNEINEKDSHTRVFKVICKKVLGKKEIQINLSQGRNIISGEKINTGDSIIINLLENKIVKIIPLEKGKTAFVTNGKHMGIQGKIEEIVVRGEKKIAKIKSENHKVNVWVKNIIVLE